jgi:protocatechuate 3,4-dioxygenase beta subunit
LNAGVVGRDEGSPLVIPLSRGEKITGRVSDGDGNPVAGASVWIESVLTPGTPLGSSDLEIRTSTGKSGLFALRAPRVLRGTFNQPGFLVIASQPGKGRGRAGPFPVPASGEPWPEVEITLSQAGVEGKVTDGVGKAVAGAKVSVIPGLPPGEDRWPLPGSGISAYSGPDGGYRIAGIERGDAMVVAGAIGYASRKIPGITIGDGFVHLDVVLEGGEAVEGRVLDSERRPVAGAEVLAVPEEEEGDAGLFDDSEYNRRIRVLETPGITAARAGQEGSFRLADLSEGTYRIIARATGYEATMSPSIRPGTSGVEIVLQRFSAVSGAVLAADTRVPVRRFTVDIVDPKKLRDLRAKSHIMNLDYRVASEGEIVFEHPGGRFLYDGLRPGEYVVLVQAEGFVIATREVSLKAGMEETVEVLLDRGNWINGIVLDKETGAPVAGAWIGVWPDKAIGAPGGGEDEDELSTVPPAINIGEDGRFSVSGLHDGNYTISIDHPSYCRPPHGSVTFEIPRGEEGPIEIHLSPAGRIEGRLRGHTGWEKGKRYMRYNLTLKRVRDDPQDPGQRKPDPWGNPLWVDSEGRYWADSLEPGTYLIELSRQIVEIGEKTSLGPAGGTVGFKEKGPEEKILGQEIEVRARETCVFNAVNPPGPNDSGGE